MQGAISRNKTMGLLCHCHYLAVSRNGGVLLWDPQYEEVYHVVSKLRAPDLWRLPCEVLLGPGSLHL